MVKGKRKELSYDTHNKAWVSWVYLPNGKRKKLYLCKAKSRTNDKPARRKAEKLLIEKKIELNILTPEVAKQKRLESVVRRDWRGNRDHNSIGGVIDLYLRSIEKRFYSDNIGQGRLNAYYYTFDVFEHFIGVKLNYDHHHKSGGCYKLLNAVRLQAFADVLRHHIDTGRYSVGTARAHFWIIKDFFMYAWETQKSEWRPTRRIKLMTENVPQKIDIKVFTPEQVRSLLMYNTEQKGRKVSRQRHPLELMVCLALNCGFQASDISTLRKNHVTVDFGRITKIRTKTGIEGSFKLWRLTLDLLTQYLNFRPDLKDDDLLFQTPGGRPLVYHLPVGRCDLLGRKLSNRINKYQPELKGLSFKHFRKTGATWIQDYGEKNPVLTQMYLCHSFGNTLKYYAKPSRLILDEALGEMEKAFGLDSMYIEPVLRR